MEPRGLEVSLEVDNGEGVVSTHPQLVGMEMPPVPDIRVVVPWAKDGPHRVVRLNLENQGIEAEYRFMRDKGPAYPNLFRELWKDGEPFILVEHDILVWPGALYLLQQCTHSWCGYSYQIRGSMESWLGCTKFEPARLGECPATAELQMWQFDVPVVVNLWDRGIPEHIHQPGVVHLNDYRS